MLAESAFLVFFTLLIKDRYSGALRCFMTAMVVIPISLHFGFWWLGLLTEGSSASNLLYVVRWTIFSIVALSAIIAEMVAYFERRKKREESITGS